MVRVNQRLLFVTCALLLLSMVLLSNAMGQESKKEKLSKTFADSLLAQLKKEKVTLDDKAKELIGVVMDRAVNQLAEDDFKEEKIKVAEMNLGKFSAEVVKQSGKNKEKIDSDTVKKSLLSICPLYPFCK
jgi:hypothetical protein